MCIFKYTFIFAALIFVMPTANAQSCDELRRQAIEKKLDGIGPFAVMVKRPSLRATCEVFSFYRLYDRTTEPISRYYVSKRLKRVGFRDNRQLTDQSANSRKCSSVEKMVDGLRDVDAPQPIIPTITPRSRKLSTVILDGVSFDVWFSYARLGTGGTNFGADLSFSSRQKNNPSIWKWWQEKAVLFDECVVVSNE